MKKMNAGILIASLVIPTLVGMISAALSMGGMAVYANMNKPPLSPPAWVFSVAWTILYFMMGLASYFIVVSDADRFDKKQALLFYAIQLCMNFAWSIIFFNWSMYLLAFIWLLAMWAVVIICAFRFFVISSIAAYLLIPYIIWLTFAAYLNLGAYILSVIP